MFILLSACDFKEKESRSSEIIIDGTSNVEEFVSTDNLSLSLSADQPSEINTEKLVLNQNARLIIGTRPIRIRAKELISEGGSITTVDKNLITDFSGFNGGQLEIIVENAAGNLTIDVSGEDGANAVESTDSIFPSSIIFDLKGADGKSGLEIVPNNVGAGYVCLIEPTNGSDGLQGLKGPDGKHGGDGGNSGKGFLIVKNESNINVEVRNDSGIGGNGSKGGLGSMGGIPGFGGKIDQITHEYALIHHKEMPQALYHSQCKSPSNGKQGPQGESGSDGKSGRDGVKYDFCVQINNSKNCY